MLRFLPLVSLMNFGDDDTAQLSAHAKAPLRALFFDKPLVQFSVLTKLLTTLKSANDIGASVIIGATDADKPENTLTQLPLRLLCASVDGGAAPKLAGTMGCRSATDVCYNGAPRANF